MVALTLFGLSAVSAMLIFIRCAERCRVLGRRCTRGQDHIVSDGGPAQGRRDRGVLVDRLAIKGGAQGGLKRMIYGGFEPIIER